jgi:hypothetical protein
LKFRDAMAREMDESPDCVMTKTTVKIILDKYSNKGNSLARQIGHKSLLPLQKITAFL